MTGEPSRGEAARQALQRILGSRREGRRSTGRSTGRSMGPSRDPATLGEALSGLIEEKGWQGASATATLLARWGDIVGPEVAEHSTCETLDEGVLTIRASSSAWATQLRLLLPQLRSAIDGAVGQGAVRDIRVLGPQGPSWRAGRLRVKGRGPRDTYG